MSHDEKHDGHHDPHPAPSRREPCNHPGNCYGMPQKRFWRIVLLVGASTMIAVSSVVVLVGA